MLPQSDLTSRINSHLAAVGSFGCLGPDKGYFRPAYSELETKAMQYFAELGVQIGFSVRRDIAANLWLEFIPGSPQAPFIEIGSHLDTVPAGGNYDGVAGIIAGFEVLRMLRDEGFNQSNLRLRIWRGEEGAIFGGPYKGSKAAFGLLSKDALNLTFDGKSLRDAMREQGADTEAIERGELGVSQAELDNIQAHLELHIEQGNCLERSNAAIGVVSGIRGATREMIEILGEFNHSGATPMGVDFRRDANLALARIVVELDALTNEFIAQGHDLVQTVSVINSDREFNSSLAGVYQNSITKVSGYAYFCLDIRSCDPDVCDRYQHEANHKMLKIAESMKVTLQRKELSKSKGIKSLNVQIQSAIRDAASSLGVSMRGLASGAGHDAAIVAQRRKSNGEEIPVGMIFIPCRDGISHSPLEYATVEQIAIGTETLAETIRLLATEN